jgi:hypothetical protein
MSLYFRPTYPIINRSRITAFIIDETQIQVGSDEAWLWVVVSLQIIESFGLFEKCDLTI